MILITGTSVVQQRNRITAARLQRHTLNSSCLWTMMAVIQRSLMNIQERTIWADEGLFDKRWLQQFLCWRGKVMLFNYTNACFFGRSNWCSKHAKQLSGYITMLPLTVADDCYQLSCYKARLINYLIFLTCGAWLPIESWNRCIIFQPFLGNCICFGPIGPASTSCGNDQGDWLSILHLDRLNWEMNRVLAVSNMQTTHSFPTIQL